MDNFSDDKKKLIQVLYHMIVYMVSRRMNLKGLQIKQVIHNMKTLIDLVRSLWVVLLVLWDEQSLITVLFQPLPG